MEHVQRTRVLNMLSFSYTFIEHLRTSVLNAEQCPSERYVEHVRSETEHVCSNLEHTWTRHVFRLFR
jgi:hypothetical protein